MPLAVVVSPVPYSKTNTIIAHNLCSLLREQNLHRESSQRGRQQQSHIWRRISVDKVQTGSNGLVAQLEAKAEQEATADEAASNGGEEEEEDSDDDVSPRPYVRPRLMTFRTLKSSQNLGCILWTSGQQLQCVRIRVLNHLCVQAEPTEHAPRR